MEGASASVLPLAGEAKQEEESQCAGPGRAHGAAASSGTREQDSPFCKAASDRTGRPLGLTRPLAA